MSGVGSVGDPAFSHIEPRECPVCNRMIKNFEAHIRLTSVQATEHQKLRQLQKEHDKKLIDALLIQQSVTGMNLINDSGINVATTQRAWDRAIEQYKQEKARA